MSTKTPEIGLREIAQQAVRSALLSWGVAWVKLDADTRKAYITLAIVEYMAGLRWPHGEQWSRIHERPWTVRDVREALEYCEHWSQMDGQGRQFGTSMAGFAATNPDDPDDPIPKLEQHFRRIYG